MSKSHYFQNIQLSKPCGNCKRLRNRLRQKAKAGYEFAIEHTKNPNFQVACYVCHKGLVLTPEGRVLLDFIRTFL